MHLKQSQSFTLQWIAAHRKAVSHAQYNLDDNGMYTIVQSELQYSMDSTILLAYSVHRRI